MENKQREEEGAFLLVEDLEEQERVVEAVLFTMGQSVEVSRLAAAMGQDEDCARKAAVRLKKRYDEERKGLQILELENAFQMCTRAESGLRLHPNARYSPMSFWKRCPLSLTSSP